MSVESAKYEVTVWYNEDVSSANYLLAWEKVLKNSTVDLTCIISNIRYLVLLGKQCFRLNPCVQVWFWYPTNSSIHIE